MSEDSRHLDQAECERLLRCYRAYWLLRDVDGTWLPMEKRRKLMGDASIRFMAEEFVEANRSRDERRDRRTG